MTGAKSETMRFYDDISRQLDSTVYGPFSLFLNFGYVPDANPSYSRIELPEYYINRNSARLVLETIGDCDLTGKRVLDVGCGRGGTVHAICKFFRPASVIGLDLSPAAISFCRAQHQSGIVAFETGDAEHLPFRDGAFDVVTNIESSQHYPKIQDFYKEVLRVLAQGGLFLYTDAMPATRAWELAASLTRTGFVLERDTDITPNVLRSCDEIALSRTQAYAGAGMDDFLGAPGSFYYEELRRGRWTYRIYRWRKGGA
jgi:phthiocerol/phenolphthiocerol synthesis type-I polyketide synthase E